MLKKIQIYLLLVIFFNLFILNIEVANVSFVIFLIGFSWILYFFELLRNKFVIKKEFIILFLFHLSNIMIIWSHGILKSELLFLLSTILISLFIGPLKYIVDGNLTKIKYATLGIYFILIVQFLFTYQLGSRTFKNFMFDINGFSYTILYLTIILILLINNTKYQILIYFLSFSIITLTFSRGAFILLCSSSLIYLIYNRSFKILIVLSLLIFIAIIFISNIGLLEDFSTRLQSVFDSSINSSSNYRKEVFFSGVNHLINYPFGTGFNSFTDFFWNYSSINYSLKRNIPIDNSYTLLIFSSGFLPLMILLVLIGRLLLKNCNILTLIILINFIGHMFFDDIIISPRFLFLYGLMFIISEYKSHDHKTLTISN